MAKKNSEPYTAADLAKLGPNDLLLPYEVADLFRVDPKTVTRWAADGKIASIRTEGGHRRFRVWVVREKLAEGSTEAVDAWSDGL